MESVICKVYETKKDGKFVFPELEAKKVDPKKLAVCISGGGCRSMSCGFGLFRFLLKKDPDIMSKISYLSGASGGSWLMILLTFIKEDIYGLIGRDIPLDKISLVSLRDVNFEHTSRFIGFSLVNFSLMSYFSEALRNGIPNNKCYQYVLAKVFLSMYGLDGKTVVESETAAYLNNKYNNLKSVYPRDDFPFLISQATLMDKDSRELGTFPYEMTPMYSGCRVEKPYFGGLYFQNQGLGCYKKRVEPGKLNNLQVKKYSGDSCLESFMAATGSAYTSTAISQSEGSLLMGIVESLAPSINVWSKTNNNDIIDIGDGVFFDNTGIVALLARGCEKILSVITTDGIKNSPLNTNIMSLFAARGSDQGPSGPYCKNTQVFKQEDWHEVHSIIYERALISGPVYFRKTLEVLNNESIGVNGNYEVDLLVIYMEKDIEFDTLLPDSFPKSVNYSLGSYPTYPIFFMTPGSIVGMTKEQVNINSTYSSWYIDKISKLPDVADFFD